MSNSRTFYYARVSSKEQNLARQIEAFKTLGADDRDIITDKQSGKDLDRPGYQALKTTMLRDGDTLVVKSLDRLSRNMDNTRRELQYFRDHNIRVKVMDIKTTMIDFPAGSEDIGIMINNLLIEVLGTFAQKERQYIKTRQAEGQAQMKRDPDTGKRISSKTGNPEGRPTAEKPSNWDAVMVQWRAGEITAKRAMELTGTKRTTFYKLAKED